MKHNYAVSIFFVLLCGVMWASLILLLLLGTSPAVLLIPVFLGCVAFTFLTGTQVQRTLYLKEKHNLRAELENHMRRGECPGCRFEQDCAELLEKISYD